MAPRPEIYGKTKTGKTIVTPEYNAYLRDLVGMDSDEMHEWYLLGVPLTGERIGKIVGLNDARAFILAPIGGNGKK